MLYTALLLGLFGSLHCVGMCSPIALLLPVNKQNKQLAIIQVLAYNFGRIVTYACIGIIFGLLGKTFSLLISQQLVSIFIGIIMILAIIFPKILSKLKIGSFYTRMILKVKNKLAIALQSTSKNTFFTIGLLNGFLPCGLVYMAILTSLTATNAFHGGFLMMAFGLGTIPLMMLVTFANQLMPKTMFQKLRTAIPVFVVIVGFLFILRGLGLNIPFISPSPNLNEVTNALFCS
ncbi:MAG: sulfite exporter TauE/SafE family protein [Polaribacter sp.]|nr:sulfite exporter TauE/SafE family protein [Polaribacter sp.]